MKDAASAPTTASAAPVPRFDVLTLHPDMVRAVLHGSILGRAVARGAVHIGVHNIRDHAHNKHGQVDDTPYGGGAGMVLRVDVVARAIEAVRTDDSHVLLTVPTGRRFDQTVAVELSQRPHVVLVCGHYEGIDARIRHVVDGEISLGDMVLTGGEICAMAVVDATARLLPNVLGNANSAKEESFSDGLLEYPHFTRPRIWRDHEVPDVLLSGHHARITAWRQAQSEAITQARRPDLWTAYTARTRPGVDDGSDKR